jgi:hypothetical protein
MRPGNPRFSNIPLNRMKAVTTVGDMRHAEVFAGRKQVFYPLGDQSAEGIWNGSELMSR